MIPTRVVFIIRIPSVKMEMSWVSLATCGRIKKKKKTLYVVNFYHQTYRQVLFKLLQSISTKTISFLITFSITFNSNLCFTSKAQSVIEKDEM